MSDSRFQTAFAAWLRRVCSTENPPKSVVAYNIGLFETPDGFSAYLIGADQYDESNNDWACRPSFTPRERYFRIPSREFERWEQVHAALWRRPVTFLTPLLAGAPSLPEPRQLRWVSTTENWNG